VLSCRSLEVRFSVTTFQQAFRRFWVVLVPSVLLQLPLRALKLNLVVTRICRFFCTLHYRLQQAVLITYYTRTETYSARCPSPFDLLLQTGANLGVVGSRFVGYVRMLELPGAVRILAAVV
jgi:hypothetical protein